VDDKATFNVQKENESAYKRYYQRLKEDLGLEDEVIEIIVKLRNQVIFLQTRLQTLQSTLEIHELRYNTRLTRYREIFEEADWEDM
jgi:hypothetical protein